MRFSITATAVCGVVATSVAAAPLESAAQFVNLAPFDANRFKMIQPPPRPAGPLNVSITGVPAVKAAAAGGCDNPPARIEWRRLNDGDKTDFVRAIRCLMDRPSAGGNYPGSRSRWEDLVSVHQQMAPGIHFVGHFLIWHRYYVAIFESLIRDECGYRGPMTWWDETLDAGNFHNAPLFTPQWFGSAPERAGGTGRCVDDGAFAGITLHLGPAAGFSDHCLVRAVDESLTKNCDAYYTDYCNGRGSFVEMQSCSESGPHAFGHNGMGGVLSDTVPSPGDPAFFMHHGFVDHAWHVWQNADPGNRLYQVGGADINGQPITVDYQLTSNGIRPPVSVGQMMDIMGGYLCYSYDY